MRLILPDEKAIKISMESGALLIEFRRISKLIFYFIEF